jgi:hypothetical protein
MKKKEAVIIHLSTIQRDSNPRPFVAEAAVIYICTKEFRYFMCSCLNTHLCIYLLGSGAYLVKSGSDLNKIRKK